MYTVINTMPKSTMEMLGILFFNRARKKNLAICVEKIVISTKVKRYSQGFSGALGTLCKKTNNIPNMGNIPEMIMLKTRELSDFIIS